jgi:hypothetical protein
MNSSTTRWLLALAVGLFLFIVFFERRAPDTDVRADRASRLFADLVPAEVSSLEYTRGTNLMFRLERAGENWQYRVPFVYPAVNPGVERMLEALAALRSRSRVTPREVRAQTNRLAAFGLDPPTATLAFRCGERRTEVRFGAATALGTQVYLQIVGQADLVTIDRNFLENLPATANDWRDPALLSLSGFAFDRITVRPGTNGFELARNPTNQVWRLMKPLSTAANNPKLQFLLRGLEQARVTRFVNDDPAADLEIYGLLPPERELVFSRDTNELATLQIGRSPTNAPAEVFVRRPETSNVVAVARSLIEPWLADFREFCDRRLVVFKPDAVERIEVQADQAFALQRLGTNQWQLVEPYVAPADTVLVLEFLENLAEMQFSRYEREVATDFAPYGLTPPRREFILRGAAVNTSTGTTNPVLAGLDIGLPVPNEQGAAFYARRLPENTVVTAFVSDRLPRAAFELRDHRIWSFTTNQIVTLTVEQFGVTRKLLRLGPVQWVLAGATNTPLDDVHNVALEEAADRLGSLRADRWVAHGDDQLGRFGFATVDHRVTVELQSGANPDHRAIRFGRRAPGGGAYAAVQLDGQREPVIFECPASLYEFILGDLSVPPPAR